MKVLLLWLGTGALSFFMEMANELRLFKDAADEGYKIDVLKLSEMNKKISGKGSLSWLLVPILNMLKVIKNTSQYNNNRSMMLTQLKVMDMLVEMNDLEKMIYQKNPTGLNAMLIELKAEMKLERSEFIEYFIDEGTGRIYYERGSDINNLTVLKATGPAETLSKDKQKEIIINEINNVLRSSVKFDDFEKFEENIRLNDDLVENNPLSELIVKKEELRSLREELINTSVEKDDDKVLIKK